MTLLFKIFGEFKEEEEKMNSRLGWISAKISSESMKISNILSYVQMINWKYLRAKTTKILNKKKKLYIDVDSNFWAEPQPRSGYDVFLTKDKLNSNIYEKKFTINFVLNADGLEHFSGSRLFGITMTTVAASRSTTTATFRRIAVKWKIFFTLKTFAFAEGNEKCSILPRK